MDAGLPPTLRKGSRADIRQDAGVAGLPGVVDLLEGGKDLSHFWLL